MSNSLRDAAAPVTGTVTAVRAGQGFDEAALVGWLAPRIPAIADGLAVRQFEGGQSNPTFLLEAGGQRWVLRKKPPGVLLPSAHLVEREARVIAALDGTPVPVPRLIVYCDDRSVIGSEFMVLEYVDGRILRDPSLPDASPAERTAIYEAAIDTLADLHAVDWQSRGLTGYGKPTAYVARQLVRWQRQYEESCERPIPAMTWLIDWLPRHLPPESPATIVHGDFRIDNLIVARDAPAVRAVLDWELSTIGEPAADVAYFCVPYYVERSGAGRGLAGLPLAELGIPDQRAMLARYAARRGVPVMSPDHVRWFVAFSMFRAAAIAVGIAGRVRQGNASSAQAAEHAALAAPFAARARAVAEGSAP
jgi:aminoglycoside phosphotransferase (APT) family kinase protein